MTQLGSKKSFDICDDFTLRGKKVVSCAIENRFRGDFLQYYRIEGNRRTKLIGQFIFAFREKKDELPSKDNSGWKIVIHRCSRRTDEFSCPIFTPWKRIFARSNGNNTVHAAVCCCSISNLISRVDVLESRSGYMPTLSSNERQKGNHHLLHVVPKNEVARKILY